MAPCQWANGLDPAPHPSWAQLQRPRRELRPVLGALGRAVVKTRGAEGARLLWWWGRGAVWRSWPRVLRAERRESGGRSLGRGDPEQRAREGHPWTRVKAGAGAWRGHSLEGRTPEPQVPSDEVDLLRWACGAAETSARRRGTTRFEF